MEVSSGDMDVSSGVELLVAEAAERRRGVVVKERMSL